MGASSGGGVQQHLQFTADADDNAASVIALAAAAGVRHVVRRVIASYDLAPAAGDRTVTIAWTRETVAKTLEVAVSTVTVGTPGAIDVDFPEGFIIGDNNTAITITLAASGTAGNRSMLNVFHREL